MAHVWQKTCRSVLLGALGVFGAELAHAADAAKQDRCAQYAQRAVQQFELMSANPQCKVATDLRWQDNRDNHYNGCMMLPEFMSKSEEAARDNHLRACGGWAPPQSAATADTSAGAAATPAPPPAPAAPGMSQNPPAASGAGGAPTTNNGSGAAMNGGANASTVANPDPGDFAVCPDSCDCALIQPSRLAPLKNRQNLVLGTLKSIGGGVLTFTDRQGNTLSYHVVRPAFYTKEVQCGCIKKDNDAQSGWLFIDPAAGSRYIEIQPNYGDFSGPVSSGHYGVVSMGISNAAATALTQIGPAPGPVNAKAAAAPPASTASKATPAAKKSASPTGAKQGI